MDKYERQLAGVDREMREVLGKAKAITEDAAAEGRGLSEDEDAKVKSLLEQVNVLKETRAEVQASIDTRNRVKAIGDAIVVEDDEAAKRGGDVRQKALSIGEAFVSSPQFKAMLDRGIQGSWSSGAVEIERKAVLDSAAVGSDATGLIQPDVQPGILSVLTQPLTVAQLMAAGTTSSSLVRYMVESVQTNGAAGVAESGLKPESALEFDATDEPVKKIATFLPVTDEMIEDVPALQSYVNGRLQLFVRQEEEHQLLNGAGGDELAGLMGRIPAGNKNLTSTVADLPQQADHIMAAITKIRVAFLEADAIVVNPLDWEAITTLKDSQGRYIGTNPFAGEAAPRLWGKTVVITQAIDQGTALVGAFATASQIFRRGGLTLEASNSHADFFQRNKTAIRCEERLALAVYRPQTFATANVSGS